LSYAPTAVGKVGTNFNYTIRFAPSCRRLRLRFAISLYLISILGKAPAMPTSRADSSAGTAADRSRHHSLHNRRLCASVRSSVTAATAGGFAEGRQGGPCGEMSVPDRPNPQEEDETPPNESAEPN